MEKKASRDVLLQIRVSLDEKKTFARSAKEAHTTLSEWVRQAAWVATRLQMSAPSTQKAKKGRK